MFQLQWIFHQKNQQFSPLCSSSSRSRKAEEKYHTEKDRFCYIGNFSPFKLNGSVPPMEHISPNPFTKVDLGCFVPAGAMCPSGQDVSRRLDEHRNGKTIFGKLESFPYTHITHFFPWCFSFLSSYHSPGHKAVFWKAISSFPDPALGINSKAGGDTEDFDFSNSVTACRDLPSCWGYPHPRRVTS